MTKNKSNNSVLEKEYIFIIGSPKSGSTWLQNMISAHPLVSTTVELTLFNRYIHPLVESWNFEQNNIEKGLWYQGLPFILSEDEFYDFLKELLIKAYKKVYLKNPKATHIVDKHPGYSFHTDIINMLLPGARFIHIIRDGRDVISSMIAAYKNIGYGTSNIEYSTKAWKEHYSSARKAKKLKNRYIEIKYEDLQKDSFKTLLRVFEFCKLKTNNKQLKTIIANHEFKKMKSKRQHTDKQVKTHKAFYRKGKTGSWREDLSVSQRYIFHLYGDKLLIDLEYASQNWWYNNIFQRILTPIPGRIYLLYKKIKRSSGAFFRTIKRTNEF